MAFSINDRTQSSILNIGHKTNNPERYAIKIKYSLLKTLHFKCYSESIAEICVSSVESYY